MSGPAQMTREAFGFRTLRARLTSAAALTYGDWIEFPELVPMSVQERCAPAVHTAKFELDLSRFDGPYPWMWKNAFKHDDRLLIRENRPEPEGDEPAPITLFAGFIIDVDWTFDGRSGGVVVTAASSAWRLKRDRAALCYGRYMRGQDAQVRLYTGLKCDFNAGGRPNRSADYDPVAGYVPGTGNPRAGAPLFTYDGDPDALWWTAADIVDYLCWHYNAAQTWLVNPQLSFPADADSARPPVMLSCEGLSLWDGLGAVSEAAGWDIWEQVARGNDGLPVASILALKRGEGTAVKFKHQPAMAAVRQRLDLRQTDLFGGSVAVGTTNSITSPIVAGARKTYEIVVELRPAWDPADLPAVNTVMPSEPCSGELDYDGLSYFTKYTRRGKDFASHADVGRLWVANEDAAYSDEPYGLDVTDLAQLAGLDSGSWPLMRCPALPRATGQTAAAPDVLVEWSVNGGTDWYGGNHIGFELLKDRLGLRITADNLADICPPGSTPWAGNLMRSLALDSDDVRIRLTCRIAGPDRLIAHPSASSGQGTAFATSQFFDRGNCMGDSAALESRMDWLTRQAEDIRDSLGDKTVEANLGQEWADADIGISDVIQGIDGINVDFGVNIGPAVRYPRVIGRTINCQAWSVQYLLDTNRKAGVE